MSLLTRSSTKDADGAKDPAPSAKPARTGPSLAFHGRRRTSATTSSAVNLLSPWVLDELRVRRLRRRFVVGAVVMAVLMGAAWGMLRLTLAQAEQDLRGDEAVGTTLQGKILELGDARVYVTGVDRRVDVVEATMGDQLALARAMREIERALPDGTGIDTLTVTLAVVPGSDPEAQVATPCPGPDPFGAEPIIGCIEFSGTAGSRYDISRMVQALGRSDMFIEPFVDATTTESEQGGETLTFEGSLGLAPDAFTGRFTDIDGSDAADPDTDQDSDQDSATGPTEEPTR